MALIGAEQRNTSVENRYASVGKALSGFDSSLVQKHDVSDLFPSFSWRYVVVGWKVNRVSALIK